MKTDYKEATVGYLETISKYKNSPIDTFNKNNLQEVVREFLILLGCIPKLNEKQFGIYKKDIFNNPIDLFNGFENIKNPYTNTFPIASWEQIKRMRLGNNDRLKLDGINHYELLSIIDYELDDSGTEPMFENAPTLNTIPLNKMIGEAFFPKIWSHFYISGVKSVTLRGYNLHLDMKLFLDFIRETSNVCPYWHFLMFQRLDNDRTLMLEEKLGLFERNCEYKNDFLKHINILNSIKDRVMAYK